LLKAVDEILCGNDHFGAGGRLKERGSEEMEEMG